MSHWGRRRGYCWCWQLLGGCGCCTSLLLCSRFRCCFDYFCSIQERCGFIRVARKRQGFLGFVQAPHSSLSSAPQGFLEALLTPRTLQPQGASAAAPAFRQETKYGNGYVAKLVNNQLWKIHAAAIGEAMVTAKLAGPDPEVWWNVMKGGCSRQLRPAA